MHELSLVLELLHHVDREVRAHGGCERVATIRLAVGALSGAHGDALRFAFDVAKSGSVAAGADLVVTKQPAELACRQCGTRVEIWEFETCCPACNSQQILISGGRDLALQSIDLVETTHAEPRLPSS